MLWSPTCPCDRCVSLHLYSCPQAAKYFPALEAVWVAEQPSVAWPEDQACSLTQQSHKIHDFLVQGQCLLDRMLLKVGRALKSRCPAERLCLFFFSFCASHVVCESRWAEETFSHPTNMAVSLYPPSTKKLGWEGPFRSCLVPVLHPEMCEKPHPVSAHAQGPLWRPHASPCRPLEKRWLFGARH